MPAITRAILRRCCTDVRQDGDIVTSMTCSLPNMRRPPTRQLGLAQSTVSKHLACLRDCGLVEARADGRASVYSLAPPAEPGLRGLLAAAEEVLAATGNAVALCPVYGRR